MVAKVPVAGNGFGAKGKVWSAVEGGNDDHKGECLVPSEIYANFAPIVVAELNNDSNYSERKHLAFGQGPSVQRTSVN